MSLFFPIDSSKELTSILFLLKDTQKTYRRITSLSQLNSESPYPVLLGLRHGSRINFLDLEEEDEEKEGKE